jgi:hypothetical protein
MVECDMCRLGEDDIGRIARILYVRNRKFVLICTAFLQVEQKICIPDRGSTSRSCLSFSLAV